MKRLIHILLFVIYFLQSFSVSATINASLDKSQIDLEETVQLTLQHEGQTDNQPDLSPLKLDFEIVRQSSGSTIQIINGKMNAQVQLNLILRPKHNGKLQIPAIQWDGQYSSAFSLIVNSRGLDTQPDDALSKKTSHHVFIISTLGQKQPYVHAAVPLKIRIFTDQPLYQASLDLQSKSEVLIQQLGQDRQTSETRNGKNYQVIERDYVVLPQRSGKIQLDVPVLDARIEIAKPNEPSGRNPAFGNIFGRNPFAGILNATQPIRIMGDSVGLNVRPRPDSANGHDWLPAHQLSLEETWQPEKGPIRAGDPMTLHLHLSAEGLAATQLPDLSQHIQLPAGLRAYPDQPGLSTNVRGNSVNGTRDQSITIIAGNAGRFIIPDMHLFWWDTEKDVQREIHLPGRTLEVLPNTKGIAI